MKLIFLMLMVGCSTTPLTAEQKEERAFKREYKYAMAVEKYIEGQKSCKQAGGVWMTYSHMSKHRKPAIHDLKMARCVETAGTLR